MAVACLALRRLRRDASPFECGGVLEALGIDYPVDVLEAACPGMPMTFGVFRPTVLLPAGAREQEQQRKRAPHVRPTTASRRKTDSQKSCTSFR